MNIRRLKFAYARGARIECQGYDTHWYGSKAPAWNGRYCYRIHPDDAHLEYGFISTGLRVHALNERNSQGYFEWGAELGGPCLSFAESFMEGDPRQLLPEDIGVAHFYLPIDEWRMYLLFMAEALCDEGM